VRTDADICNMALLGIGARGKIASLDDPSREAQLCSAFYETARDAALREFPWPFATRRVTLTQLVVSDHPPPPEWLYRYGYPADCLAARYLLTDGPAVVVAPQFLGSNYWALYGATVLRAQPQDFTTEQTDDGTLLSILTNVNPARLVYTVNVIDPTRYDAQFTLALAWKLAWHLAVPLTGDEKKGVMAQAGYTQALSSAWATAHGESRPTASLDAEWIQARG
jgi:hypothetical protein